MTLTRQRERFPLARAGERERIGAELDARRARVTGDGLACVGAQLGGCERRSQAGARAGRKREHLGKVAVGVVRGLGWGHPNGHSFVASGARMTAAPVW